MSKDFYTAAKERRTFYNISPESKISDIEIEKVVKEALLHAPSAFNSQSSKVVLLLGEHHKKLWDITQEALLKIISPEQAQETKDKITSFGKGYGTVLYFDDSSIVKGLQENFPLYKDNFPIWAHQSSGMLQYLIWTSLELEGFGASLQHYNPLIDQKVKEEWSIPRDWSLIAQMPFGVPTGPPNEKSYAPIEERFIIHQ
jgi:predicted oxidoreductase (fatty acid repression mutant protein)